MAFDYPGNIRQLENFCHWLTVMSAGQWVDVGDLPPELGVSAIGAPGSTPVRLDKAAGVLAHPAQNNAVLWTDLLGQEATGRFDRNEPAVMTTLVHDFERVLLRAALAYSRGRRAEAAQRLGIGRNTLTRKCQELGLDDD
jgi:two-component system nitrogen regulation response regulator GlnG